MEKCTKPGSGAAKAELRKRRRKRNEEETNTNRKNKREASTAQRSGVKASYSFIRKQKTRNSFVA